MCPESSQMFFLILCSSSWVPQVSFQAFIDVSQIMTRVTFVTIRISRVLKDVAPGPIRILNLSCFSCLLGLHSCFSQLGSNRCSPWAWSIVLCFVCIDVSLESPQVSPWFPQVCLLGSHRCLIYLLPKLPFLGLYLSWVHTSLLRPQRSILGLHRCILGCHMYLCILEPHKSHLGPQKFFVDPHGSSVSSHLSSGFIYALPGQTRLEKV